MCWLYLKHKTVSSKKKNKLFPQKNTVHNSDFFLRILKERKSQNSAFSLRIEKCNADFYLRILKKEIFFSKTIALCP